MVDIAIYWFIAVPLVLSIGMVAYFYYRGKTAKIFNMVQYYRKGGTMTNHPATIIGACIRFKPDKAEVNASITSPPRIRTIATPFGGRTERVYLVKEGGSDTVEIIQNISPAQEQVIRKAKDVLSKYGIVASQEEIIDKSYINFNVETDGKLLSEEDNKNRHWTTLTNEYESMHYAIQTGLKKTMGLDKWAIAGIVIGCLVCGFLLGTVLQLQGGASPA